jgi:pimeloyl-ACP methyl ester carboxylesterase
MPEYLDLPHGTIHCKDYGGEGRPLVMVHGLGGSLTNWDAIGPRLAELGHAVALDLPGFGLSPPGHDWTLETHAAAVVDVVEHFGGPAVLIGNSMGGLVSEMVAASRSELVDALILIAPATPPRIPDPNITWPVARRALIGSAPGIGPVYARRIITSTSPRELVNEWLGRIAHKPGGVSLEMVEALVDVAERRRSLPWVVHAMPKTAQSIRSVFLRRSRFVSMIRDIRAPTLVIQGVADPIVSVKSVDWLCYLRPDWTLARMEDTGHIPQMEAPVRTLSVIGPWLAARI